MKDIWKEMSIGQIMQDPEMSKAVLKVIESDKFLYGYFTSFGKNAKHSFAEIEEGSQMAGAIDKDTLMKIKEAINAKI